MGSGDVSCTRYVQPRLKERLMRGEEPGWLRRHPRRAYIVQAVLSAPPWVDRKALYALRDEARRLTRVTGVQHVLDHYIPLTHPYVCGLTVPWNLKVTTYGSNASKGNTWARGQAALDFGERQLDLLQPPTTMAA